MLAAAAGCAALFAALLGLAYSVEPAQRVDAAALNGFSAVGDDWRIAGLAERVSHAFNPAPYAVMVIALLVIALLLRRHRQAVAAGVLLVGANVSSQVLKPLLAHPRDLSGYDHANDLGAAAFPSGHATAAMSLALAAVVIAPHAYRPLVAALGGLVALAVSGSLLVLSWHWPSDVVGGYLLATAWCLVALAGLRAAAMRWPQQGSMRRAIAAPSLAVVAGGALVLVAVAGVAVLARVESLATYAAKNTAMVAVGAAIVAAAMVLLAAVTALAARRR
jgi:membrane-associated phospholipid phosphatase